MKIISFWMKKTWNTFLKHRTYISTHPLTHLLLLTNVTNVSSEVFQNLKTFFENIVLIDEKYLFLNEKHEARFSNISFWMNKHETRFKPTIELPSVGPTRQRGPAREPRAQLETLPLQLLPLLRLLTSIMAYWHWLSIIEKLNHFFSLNSLGGHH